MFHGALLSGTGPTAYPVSALNRCRGLHPHRNSTYRSSTLSFSLFILLSLSFPSSSSFSQQDKLLCQISVQRKSVYLPIYATCLRCIVAKCINRVATVPYSASGTSTSCAIHITVAARLYIHMVSEAKVYLYNCDVSITK